jgi:hypothetical protein
LYAVFPPSKSKPVRYYQVRGTYRWVDARGEAEVEAIAFEYSLSSAVFLFAVFLFAVVPVTAAFFLLGIVQLPKLPAEQGLGIVGPH